MKSRERFVTALHCGVPDRVPVYDFVGGRRIQQQLLGYTTDLYEPETQAKLARLLGFDAFPVFLGGFCGIEEEAHPEGAHFMDEWGVTYVKEGWPIMPQTATPIQSRADWSHYQMPNPGAPGGGYVLATDHSLHDDISLENIRAYVETAHRYGTYPLDLPESIP